MSGCRVARTYVLNCYVQEASSKLQLYKSIVVSFNIALCSIMSGLLDSASQSRNSDSARSGNGTKKENHVKSDKNGIRQWKNKRAI